MKETQGFVTEVDRNGMARVVIRPDDGCGPCGSAGQGCHCSGEAAARKMMVKVRNTAEADVGDFVSLAFRSGAVLKSLLITIGIPCLGLLAGGLVNGVFGREMFFASSGSAVINGLGVLLGILTAVLIYRRVSQDIQPFVSRILTRHA